MGVPTPWYALAAAATLINGLVLGYVARREGSPALRLWAWAWLAWAAAVLPLAQLDRSPDQRWPALLCGLCWVLSTLAFLGGSYELSARRFARGWYALAGVCLAAALALGIDPDAGVGMLPLVLFQAVGLGAAGVMIIRAGRGRTGAWLSGLSLIGLALHLIDTPVLAAHPGLMPWGFVMAAALEMLTALGMLVLYYEHGRAQLLEAQRALAETRRIEALGRVAGGVAHDFNNMLTVMQGHLELIRMDPADSQNVNASLQAMGQAVAQAGRLTAQLLAFGRRAVIQPETIDVRRVTSDALQLLKKVMPENIEVTFRASDGPLLASMDRSLLEQIVLNLVTNARDAISGPGHIALHLERTDSPTSTLRLRVTDDGSGMEASVLSHVFEPFFTTKAEGKGSGLGLASVQGAVTQLGGQIHVDSRPGLGTTFDITLPLGVPREQPTPRAARPRTGPLDILVVDDAERVRDVSASMLSRAGHRVQQAGDGREALEMALASHYDVVLSDVVMPHMGGVELAHAISSQRPETLVVLTSGYPQGSLEDAAQIGFLPKPFQRDTLLDTVERLVSEHRATHRASEAAPAAASP